MTRFVDSLVWFLTAAAGVFFCAALLLLTSGPAYGTIPNGKFCKSCGAFCRAYKSKSATSKKRTTTKSGTKWVCAAQVGFTGTYSGTGTKKRWIAKSCTKTRRMTQTQCKTAGGERQTVCQCNWWGGPTNNQWCSCALTMLI